MLLIIRRCDIDVWWCNANLKHQSPSRNLRSSTHGDLLMSRTREITYQPRSCAVSGPCVWNDLPLTLRTSPSTLRQFQSTLNNIVLFSLRDMIWACVTVWDVRTARYKFTYLLTYLLTTYRCWWFLGCGVLLAEPKYSEYVNVLRRSDSEVNWTPVLLWCN